jgi:hypothetical protein
MDKRYQEMFDEVRASDKLRKEVMNMTNMDRTEKRRRHLPRAAVIAAVIAVMMTGTALAVAVAFPGSLLGWFEQQWQEISGKTMPEAQAELIESLTQPVGVSDTQEGVTVTLDSITVGDSALWLMLKAEGDFTLGEEVTAHYFGPEDLVFAENPDTNDAPGGNGFDYAFSGVAEDGKLTLLLRYTTTLTGEDTLLGGGDATLHLQDFIYDDTILVAGEWTLPFTIQPVDEQSLLTLDSATVPASDHDNGSADVVTTLHDIQISSTGIRFTQSTEEQMYQPHRWAVTLSDGTEICMDGGGSRWSEAVGVGVWASDYYWKLPVNLSQVEALRFGRTLIPLK